MGEIVQMITTCDFCLKDLDTSKDRWLFQDDGSYIHIDCIRPALEEYQKHLDDVVKEKEFKLLSRMDVLEPFEGNWLETCEWCGYDTKSPNETHICQERV